MSNILIAKQFTAIYDEKEDRLRLIININYPNRYDFWITRKFLIDIMDNLQNYLIRFNKNNNENSLNKTFNNTKNLPIYEATNQPYLLEKLNITKKNNFFILTLYDQKTTIQTTLTLQDLKNLLKIIIQPVKIRWGLGF